MDKVGIIAGSGNLPLLIGRNLVKKNYLVSFFCIKNFANINNYKDFENIEIELNSFTKILSSLEDQNIDKIIMIGKITRPSIKDIKFDINTFKLIKDFLLESKGDDQLLKSISNFFLKKGYPLFNWKDICSDLFSKEDNLTINMPSKEAIKNKDKGLKIFSTIGKADIGQSLIIQNELVLGVECLEGTDALIERCSSYKKRGDKGILLKLSKYKQHTDLDLPTIGIDTIKYLKKFNYEGLFIEKQKCLIIDKEIVVNFCNESNMFLSTVNKID